MLGPGSTAWPSPTWLPAVKYRVRAMTMADAKALAKAALHLGPTKEICAKGDAFSRAKVKVE